MSDRLKEICVNFFAENIRKFFWGITLNIVIGIMFWGFDLKEQSETMIIAEAGFILTQFKAVKDGKAQ